MVVRSLYGEPTVASEGRPSATLETLVIEDTFVGWSADALFACWIEPTLLTQWWPQFAEVVPRLCGAYHYAWPEMRWHLRGHYTAFLPGRRLGFTWRWDSDPDDALTRHVDITFEPLAITGGGTRLILQHGPYTDAPAEHEQRRQHLDGWLHFLGRLHQLDPNAQA